MLKFLIRAVMHLIQRALMWTKKILMLSSESPMSWLVAVNVQVWSLWSCWRRHLAASEAMAFSWSSTAQAWIGANQKLSEVKEMLSRIFGVIWLLTGHEITHYPKGMENQTGILTNRKVVTSGAMVGSKSCNSGTLVASNLFLPEKLLQLVNVE